MDLLDLQVGEFVKTGLKHKLTVKSELAESQRQVIRNEHERAIKEKSTRTIKTLTPMTGSSTQKRTITQKKALIAEQAVKEAQSIQIEMNLQNRLVHLLILKPLTLTLLCQRLKASSTNLQPLLDTYAWLDPISTCYSLRKESVRLIKPRAWPHYSARERQIVADNLLKLQMTGDYGLPTLQPQESGMERSSTSSYSGVKKPSVNGVKGRIQKVISRIRK